MHSLSGGERAKLLIARLMLKPADVLLLDEPTNDLDIPSLEALEESILDFPGAVVLVSHDRFLLSRVCTSFFGLDGQGKATVYGSFEQWERELTALQAPPKPQAASRPKKPEKKTAKLSYLEQREYEQMESQVLKEEALVEKLKHDLEKHGPAADPEKLEELCLELHQAQARLEALFTRWQELENKK